MQTHFIKDKHQKNTYLYDQDFHLWIQTTAQLLRENRFSEVDLENLIAEIESMGRQEKNSLRSNLRVVLMHLLKYKYQPQKRSRSWLLTIFEHRTRIQETLADNPSLKRYYQEIFAKCYKNARKEASIETGLKLTIFPESSPFNDQQTLDSEYLPE